MGLSMGVAPTSPEADAERDLSQLAPVLSAMPEVTLSTYPVEGRNPRAIRQNMNRLRPRQDDGEAFDALTSWRFASRWKTQAGKCLPQSIEIKVNIGVILPELVQYGRLSRSDRQRWDRYYAALVQHETHHARIAITGSQLMQEQLRQAASCTGLEAVGQRLADEVAAASTAYDTRSDHGRLEGAVFP